MSVGGDGTRGGNAGGEGGGDKRCACNIGDELSGGDGIDEGRRWGVGDTGDGGRLSTSLGGVGGVVITGEEYGTFSCSSSTCAPSSYKRAGDWFSFIAWGKLGKNCLVALPFARGQLFRVSRPHFVPRTVVARG
jgi:hypothetical protein